MKSEDGNQIMEGFVGPSVKLWAFLSEGRRKPLKGFEQRGEK